MVKTIQELANNMSVSSVDCNYIQDSTISIGLVTSCQELLILFYSVSSILRIAAIHSQTDNTLLCGWRFEPDGGDIMHVNIYFKIFWRNVSLLPLSRSWTNDWNLWAKSLVSKGLKYGPKVSFRYDINRQDTIIIIINIFL